MPKGKPLTDVMLEKAWPVLSAQALAFTELEQDEFYSFIRQEEIPHYIDTAIQLGQEAAKTHTANFSLKELMNELIKQRVKVRFLNHQPQGDWVRAQYTKKPATIEIYRSSLEQMKQFFLRMNEHVCHDDLLKLHLYHEWFHHLEETKIGRTDLALPKIKIKQWGPFTAKKSIRRIREIAAHAFTQTAMGLNWSPLLLDHLLLHIHQGWTPTQIREHFQRIRHQYEQLVKTKKDEENTKNDEQKANP